MLFREKYEIAVDRIILFRRNGPYRKDAILIVDDQFNVRRWAVLVEIVELEMKGSLRRFVQVELDGVRHLFR